MAWVDIALLAMLAISVLLGLWRGLVFELLSIAGWVVAYLAAPYIAPYAQGWLPQERLGPNLLHALGLVIGFVLVLVVWGLSARMLRALIHASPLSALDRMGGAAFGLLRAGLLSLLVFVLVGMTPAVNSQAWRDSQLAPWLGVGLQGLRPLLPQALHEYIPV
ncbi:CvpA family protein [Pelomonas sp. CA6]|uniref:CvpA family protein n=1 Tax=Pelomonas sp. CA6 TaxID=2907999 RepID=UPI001F4C43F3|nr:CvpA family protein [Pelomonas sp. CA6]MCH7345523.1 CvpA family protein [Pelomonas sp. CA6]